MLREPVSQIEPEVILFDRQLIEERNYWRDKLGRELGVSGLRPDFQRSNSFLMRTGVVPLRLEGELYDRLCKLTGNGPFLIYTTLLTALKVCLFKYTTNSCVVIGSPAVKDNEDTNQALNAVVIVDEVSAEQSFKELLQQVRQTLLDAYSRQSGLIERCVDAP